MCKKLDSLLAAAGIELPDQQKQQLLGYVGMLDKWNKAYNLIAGARSAANAGAPHPRQHRGQPASAGIRCLSMSAPAPVYRAFRWRSCVRMRISRCSIAWASAFLRQVQHELGLNNIEPVQSRVEAFPAEPFDGVGSAGLCSLRCRICCPGAITCRRKGRGVFAH